jgi:hypothetical protein
MLTKNDLKAIGISASIMGVVLVVAAGFYMYRNFLETQKLRLEIKQIKKDLGTA